MEAPAVLEELPPGAAPGKGAHELFGYVGIEAVLDQMRVKTMKTGFEFNIMVVGERSRGWWLETWCHSAGGGGWEKAGF